MDERSQIGVQGSARARTPAFHELLLGYRAAANEAPKDLAAAIGVSVKTIQAYERPASHSSARTPPSDVFRRLCVHLHDKNLLTPAEYAAFASARAARRRRRGAQPPLTLASRPGKRLTQPAIPRRLTALIGRQELVGGVCALLQQSEVALLTLVGPGGVGKTHLALEVAARSRDVFPDGVWWIELAPVAAPDDVAGSIAVQMGLHEPATVPPRERLIARLGEAHALLVLDNFEHVLPAAFLVSDLLSRCAHLTVLVTSRVPLRLHGEQERRVPPLERDAASRLFVRRVRDSLPGFARTEQNAAAIDGICARLNDLPLALELAARQLRRYGTPEALLAALAPALPHLVGGPRDAPRRQRTMRAAVVWSYALLAPEAQTLFRRLAVCRGGCTPAAACGLGDDLAEVDGCLAALIDHGLIQRAARSSDARLSMFEVVREYGLEQLGTLGETGDAARRHATYYLALAEEAESNFQKPEQARWDRLLVRERDNLRAALDWAIVGGEGALALRFIVALWRHWDRKGLPPEARRWADGALALAEGVPDKLHARGLYAAAHVPLMQNDDTAAERWLHAGHDLAERIGDRSLLSDMLIRLGVLAYRRADYGRAQELETQALEILESLGSVVGIAEVHLNLGIAALLQWQPAEAEAHYTQAGALLRDMGDTRGVALACFGLGAARTMLTDWPGARAAYREALGVARKLRDIDLLIYVIYGIAAVAGLTGDAERAARLFGAGARLCEEHAVELPPSFRALVETTQGMVRQAMTDPQEFDGWYEEGKELALADALTLARQCVQSAEV